MAMAVESLPADKNKILSDEADTDLCVAESSFS